MRIFCPAISRPYLSSGGSPPSPPPTPEVGRVASYRREPVLGGRVLELAPDATSGREGSRGAARAQLTARDPVHPIQQSNARSPATPPEQPAHLVRRPDPKQIRFPGRPAPGRPPRAGPPSRREHRLLRPVGLRRPGQIGRAHV